jgi:hypothetical protein
MTWVHAAAGAQTLRQRVTGERKDKADRRARTRASDGIELMSPWPLEAQSSRTILDERMDRTGPRDDDAFKKISFCVPPDF